jgi:hypothetical protein
MVVDYIENHFESFTMKGLHHGLKLSDVLSPLGRSGIANIRGKKSDGIVPPIIMTPLIVEVLVSDKVVDRQQFDRRHA